MFLFDYDGNSYDITLAGKIAPAVATGATALYGQNVIENIGQKIHIRKSFNRKWCV